MFNKLKNFFSTKKTAEEASIDLSLGYSRLNAFRNRLKQEAYQDFENEYGQLEWDAKTLLNEGIGLDVACAGMIEAWVKARPGSYIAQLFAGVSKTCLAWAARTAVAGASVSEARAEQFISLLGEASDHLGKADTINPEDPEICARMIRVCTGLSAESEIASGYFQAATELEPNHLMAHLMMISYLSPKWLGSIDEMHEFANRQYAESDNNLLAVLPLIAITEEWVYYGMMGEKTKYKNYFANEALLNTVTELYEAFEEPEEGALLTPWVYNYFAFLFYKFNQKDLAKKIIRSLDGKMTVYPWAYLDITSNTALQKLAG